MTTTAATRAVEYTALVPVLHLAFELGQTRWKLGFTTGLGQRPRERTIAARDLGKVAEEIGRAKERFGLAPDAPVVSCYEAGRDGFWLHRYLVAQGIASHVVDSASIEVNRRRRRAKSDRLDVGKLLFQLVRYRAGERKVWSVVHVPTEAAEDGRQAHRELLTLKRDRARVTNRIKGLLANQGVVVEVTGDFPELVAQVRRWDGSPLPAGLHARLEREWAKVTLLTDQIHVLEAERQAALRTSADPGVERVRQLLRLRGIGTNSAWLYVVEFFGWRAFRNRREVGALAGLTPTPYQSGEASREQGIGKAGNRYIRAMAIEIAWGWLRFQPASELSRWYEARFGQGSSRVRRIGIVALARRLLVELWRYLETGAVPAGAVLKG
jgi:transposase